MNDLSHALNLGPKSSAMLQSAGISTLDQLKALGSVEAYCRVKMIHARASLNLLWAMEGAISGEPWQHVAREHRTSLLYALEERLKRREPPARRRPATRKRPQRPARP